VKILKNSRKPQKINNLLIFSEKGKIIAKYEKTTKTAQPSKARQQLPFS